MRPAAESNRSQHELARRGLRDDAPGALVNGWDRRRLWTEPRHFEDNDRILMAQGPVGRIETVYTLIGDALPLACGLVILIALAAVARRGSVEEKAR